jgi:hypothetical protein
MLSKRVMMVASVNSGLFVRAPWYCSRRGLDRESMVMSTAFARFFSSLASVLCVWVGCDGATTTDDGDGDGDFAPVSKEFDAVGGMFVVSTPGVLAGVLVSPRMRMFLFAGVFLSS